MDVLRRNNVRILGEEQQPMLFAHGFGCDQNMWRFITPSLQNTFKVVLFDYVGNGKADPSAYDERRYSNLNGYADDILEICASLALRDVILVGHSVSSIIGLLAAVREPERFSSIIMVAPSPCYIDDPPNYRGGFKRAEIEELLATMERNYIGWANFLAPVVIGRPDRPELTEELKQSFCSTDPIMARRFAEATFLADNRQDLSKLEVPSLILQCSEDAVAPVEVGEFMHRHMPESTLKIINTMGHCPHMSAPELTIQAIRDYLQSDLPKRRPAAPCGD